MIEPTPISADHTAAANVAVSVYAQLHRSFRWQVPAFFNIASVCCERWARDTPDAVAIRHELADGRCVDLTYAQLQQQANRLSHALERLGVQPGDRVAIVLPQCLETAIAHIAVYQLGAVAMPLSLLFGPEALAYRLQDSEATLAIVDASAVSTVQAVRASCPALTAVIAVAEPAASPAASPSTAPPPPPADARVVDWAAALSVEQPVYVGRITRADDPAILIYTSGTTGPPKGALLPHRALIGNLTGFVCSQNWFAAEGDADGDADNPPVVFWSPADWAWTGGLMDALLPTLYFGRQIVALQGRFQPEQAFELMARYRVTHSFIFPTALKAMMKAVPRPRAQYRLRLRALMSAGEAVGDAVFNWCRDELGVPVNEMFGQTEINYIVGNCAAYRDTNGAEHPGWPARPGSMGRPYPGHRVAVIDDNGAECPRGVPGDVALHRLDVHGDPDPVFFLGYWRNDEATRAKFTGDDTGDDRPPGRPKGDAPPRGAGSACDALGVPSTGWCRTGDTAVMDADGYLWYQGRSDDVFKVAGYRIGPSEIENCLVKHPAVANAAVVPKPDRERGALVKAYVVLAAGHEASAALVGELQAHVRSRLAPYEYPKEIEFIEALPMTTTGKVQRRVLRLQEEERAGRAGQAWRARQAGKA